MKLKIMTYIACFFIPVYAFAEDDWFDSPLRGFGLNFRAGQFDEGASLGSVRGFAPLLFGSEVSASFTQLHGNDQDEKSYSVFLRSDTARRFTAGIGVERSERGAAYENEDFHLLLGWNYRRWYFEFIGTRGELSVEPPGITNDVLARLESLGVLTADREGRRLTANYYGDRWGLQLLVANYELTRDRELQASDLEELLQELGLDSRRDLTRLLRNPENFLRLNLLIRTLNYSNQEYYRQVNQIADSELGLSAYVMRDALTYSSGLFWYDNIFTDETDVSVFGSIDYALSDNVLVGFLLSTSAGEGTVYGELSLGFMW